MNKKVKLTLVIYADVSFFAYDNERDNLRSVKMIKQQLKDYLNHERSYLIIEGKENGEVDEDAAEVKYKVELGSLYTPKRRYKIRY